MKLSPEFHRESRKLELFNCLPGVEAEIHHTSEQRYQASFDRATTRLATVVNRINGLTEAGFSRRDDDQIRDMKLDQSPLFKIVDNQIDLNQEYLTRISPANIQS